MAPPKKNMNLSLDKYIPMMVAMFLFIPEGVLVMTVALMGWMWRLRLEGNVPFDPGELRTGQPGAL
jgi:hypothetical protein